jgi:formylglycine-generating enzyme
MSRLGCAIALAFTSACASLIGAPDLYFEEKERPPEAPKCDGGCGPSCTACPVPANGEATCDGTACGVRCNTAFHVSGTTCERDTSCTGLARTCGASRTEDCCATALVPGGTFNRSNDPSAPAVVSTFRLDLFEITVGRFRNFVAHYAQDMIPAGAGKNPNNPSDPGWTLDYNTSLPATASALMAGLHGPNETWTDAPGPNESMPIVKITWYDAFAFCAWDGGRLPTEAEWNYAAAGGAEQRTYPWGNNAPGPDTQLAVWGCHYPGCSVAPVGHPIAGAARWGHLDMSGNSWEWTRDTSTAYLVPCNDCVIDVSGQKAVRSGSAGSPLDQLPTTVRLSASPSDRLATGARCAR